VDESRFDRSPPNDVAVPSRLTKHFASPTQAVYTSLLYLNCKNRRTLFQRDSTSTPVLTRIPNEKVYLNSNDIGPAGAVPLAEGLPIIRVGLQVLAIGENIIGDIGATAIPGALAERTLDRPSLNDRNIGGLRSSLESQFCVEALLWREQGLDSLLDFSSHGLGRQQEIE
jgi:hypothetical protein